MKRKAITMLMASALLAGSAVMPAYAAEETSQTESAAEAVNQTETAAEDAGQTETAAEENLATFQAKVEIPAGSNVKYETDMTGHIVVDRFMTMAVKYPANYVSVENTLAGDGDPLDALVFTREPLNPGSTMECRPIGYLKMTDGGDEDQKLIAVPVSSVDATYDEIQDITDLPAIELERIQDFFATYKLLPEGSKEVVLDGYENAAAAAELLRSAQAAYEPSEAEWVNLNNYTQAENAPDEINVAIEIPQGTSIKYELDAAGNIIADRFQSTSVAYPANYGSIVSTTAGDGDPLDALVFTRTPIYPGSVITCRPIGYLKMIDKGEADEKVIAVPVDDVDLTYADIQSIDDLPAIELQRMEQFFANYKNLPQGKNKVELSGYEDADAAKTLISDSMNNFQPAEGTCVNLNEYPQDGTTESLNAVIEIPQGTAVKYELGADGKPVVDRFMPMSMVYPANYGIITSTTGGDGDPLDVLLYTRDALISGSVVAVRPIGVLHMIDDGDTDEKIIAVPVSDVDSTYDEITSIEDLPAMELQRLEQFFNVYKILPDNTPIETSGYEGADAANAIINAALVE